MVVVGADVHKRTHTFVAVDEVGRQVVVRVPPKMMAEQRRIARTRGSRMNAAIHRIAITQARMPATLGKAYYEKKLNEGKSKTEALRGLKRRLARVVFQHLTTDHNNRQAPALPAAA
ncbi:MAG: hypothetical protein LKG20_00150 [Tetrasphaera jenkinsii]|nr:hypothetical protein [Tetrasphaera jenkinsii]